MCHSTYTAFREQTSCLTETFFPQALDRARFLDEYLQREGKPIGPLHGLPISIKDSFCVEGVQSTVGYVACLNNAPATSDSALVTMLLELGAVLYVKTNVPQTMMVSLPNRNSSQYLHTEFQSELILIPFQSDR